MTENVQEPSTQAHDPPVGPSDCERELAACRQESEERLQSLLRARADFDNQAKRTVREIEKAHKYAVSELVEAVLPVQDSLELGLETAVPGIDVETVRQGMALTHEKLQAVLEKFGVEVINPLGEPFDPERHEAMSMALFAELPPNSVAVVHQKGYLLNGRLIRPARVIVSMTAERSEKADDQDTPGA